MTSDTIIRSKSILDPEPTEEMIKQCETYAGIFISDENFRNYILSKLNTTFGIDSSSIMDYKILKPNTVQFQITILKASNNIKEQKNFNGLMGQDSAVWGQGICVPIENAFCPLILQYDDKNSTINHEAIHIYQSLKESFYPFDNQLTRIDRKSFTPSDAVHYILNNFGKEKAFEYAVKKPAALFREEAEAWWKVDKNDDNDPLKFVLSYAIVCISKFICAVCEDLKSPCEENLIETVCEYINFIGEKDYYCSRIVGLLNKKYKKYYSFDKWIKDASDAMLNFKTESLGQVIKLLCQSFNLKIDLPE